MSMILNNVLYISILHRCNDCKSNLSYWYLHSRYQNSSSQKNSDLCYRFFCRNHDGECIFSFITRSNRGVWIYLNNKYFHHLRSFTWILYRKSYSSKSLSYANHRKSQTSFCTNEFSRRYVS